MLKEDAYNWIDDNESRIIEISDAIWELAEVGLQEHKSSKLQAEELEKHGFEIEMGVAGMNCSGCVSKLERALLQEEGVASVVVTLDPGKAVVRGSIARDRIRQVVEQLGYQVVAPS